MKKALFALGIAVICISRALAGLGGSANGGTDSSGGAGGGGDVFTASNNVFTASNTYNGNILQNGTNALLRLYVGGTNATFPGGSDRFVVFGDSEFDGAAGHNQNWNINGSTKWTASVTTSTFGGLQFDKAAGGVHVMLLSTNNGGTVYMQQMFSAPTNLSTFTVTASVPTVNTPQYTNGTVGANATWSWVNANAATGALIHTFNSVTTAYSQISVAGTHPASAWIQPGGIYYFTNYAGTCSITNFNLNFR